MPPQQIILDAEMVAYSEQREAIDGLPSLAVPYHSNDIYRVQSSGEYVGLYLAPRKVPEQA